MNNIPRATGKYAYMAERADYTRRLFNGLEAARQWANSGGSVWIPSHGGGWTLFLRIWTRS